MGKAGSDVGEKTIDPVWRLIGDDFALQRAARRCAPWGCGAALRRTEPIAALLAGAVLY